MSINPVLLTQDLIRCPSVTPIEGGALDLLQSTLEGLGFTCSRLPFSEEGTPDVDNLYARYGESQPNLCFAGHTDVVPVGEGAQWKYGPFEGCIDNGYLYGRGAVDMKGAIACWVSAISQLFATGWRPKGSLSFLITGDEEGPSINGTQKMLETLYQAGERWDACITGEPTNPKVLGDMIKIGRRGCMDVHLTVQGIQGHTGYPHLADNAAHRLVTMLQGLLDWTIDTGTEYFQPSTLAVSTIDIGNPATNIIPDRASASINLRYSDEHTGLSLEKDIKERLLKINGSAEMFEMKTFVAGDAFLTLPGSLTDIVKVACFNHNQKSPELSTTGGTSDSRFIKNYCPVVDFGLISQTMHQVDECVGVNDIEDLTKIYRGIIELYFQEN